MTPERSAGREASRELDAEIAEKVMGEVLTVPREMAMAMVGSHYVSVTGPVFELDVHGFDISIAMPDGERLGGHPSDDNWNQRYLRHAVEELLKFPNEIAPLVEADIAACRLTPKPYSADIAAAFQVVEKMRVRRASGPMSVLMGFDHIRNQWRCEFLAPDDKDWSVWADTLPLSICLASLKALASLSDTTSPEEQK